MQNRPNRSSARVPMLRTSPKTQKIKVFPNFSKSQDPKMDAPIRNFTLSLYVAVCVRGLFTSAETSGGGAPRPRQWCGPTHTQKHTHTHRAILLRGFHSNFACGRAHTNDQALNVWQLRTKETKTVQNRPNRSSARVPMLRTSPKTQKMTVFY